MQKDGLVDEIIVQPLVIDLENYDEDDDDIFDEDTNDDICYNDNINQCNSDYCNVDYEWENPRNNDEYEADDY